MMWKQRQYTLTNIHWSAPNSIPYLPSRSFRAAISIIYLTGKKFQVTECPNDKEERKEIYKLFKYLLNIGIDYDIMSIQI